MAVAVVDEESLIKEGFLCPICMKDLQSFTKLESHFQNAHSEEQIVLKSIKELYGKAKKKILKLDEKDLESFRNEIKLTSLEYNEPQADGLVTKHTDYFKSVRRERLDHRTTETNKLIIRLYRLLRYFGSDRKQQEQEIVTWLDGTTVSRCPSCASSFNLTRRQHHCRLCGSIMCHSCSYFLSYETAITIITPVVPTSEAVSSKDAETLRICQHCLNLLESRRQVQLEQMLQPIVCQLYSQIQKVKTKIANNVEQYYKMLNSLTSCKTTYQLHDLQNLRTEIARNAELLDTLAKKIASLPVDLSTPKAAALQNSIRKAISFYIRESLLSLPAPPTLEELERTRVEQSRKFVEDYSTTPTQQVKKVTVSAGWTPANVLDDVEEESDPLMLQINIVRNYIEQAQLAKRFDEVASLEENLRQLKRTYSEQKHKLEL